MAMEIMSISLWSLVRSLLWIGYFAKMVFDGFQWLLRHGYLLRDSQFYLILDAIALMFLG